MSFSILGLGTALPGHAMSQGQATELANVVACHTAAETRLLSALYRKSGVTTRYTAVPHQIAYGYANGNGATNGNGDASRKNLGLTTRQRMQFYEQHAYPLAREAVERALAEAALDPRRVTHLITVSCTGFMAPGVDVELIDGLGLPRTTERIQVGFMGCHGAINGLRTALAIAGSDPQARILLCTVELCSLHYRFDWDPQRFLGNALFADGAAAIVGGASPAGDAWRVLATGSCLLPDSADAMTWRIGDHGFEMTLSARVPELIREHLSPWLAAWLDKQGTSIEAIGSWAIHPGGPRILSAAEESLQIGRDATATSREVLAAHGNMSSPTVLFILDRLRQRQAPRPCVALGFGPGLVAEAALLG